MDKEITDVIDASLSELRAIFLSLPADRREKILQSLEARGEPKNEDLPATALIEGWIRAALHDSAEVMEKLEDGEVFQPTFYCIVKQENGAEFEYVAVCVKLPLEIMRSNGSKNALADIIRMTAKERDAIGVICCFESWHVPQYSQDERDRFEAWLKENPNASFGGYPDAKECLHVIVETARGTQMGQFLFVRNEGAGRTLDIENAATWEVMRKTSEEEGITIQSRFYPLLACNAYKAGVAALRRLHKAALAKNA